MKILDTLVKLVIFFFLAQCSLSFKSVKQQTGKPLINLRSLKPSTLVVPNVAPVFALTLVKNSQSPLICSTTAPMQLSRPLFGVVEWCSPSFVFVFVCVLLALLSAVSITTSLIFDSTLNSWFANLYESLVEDCFLSLSPKQRLWLRWRLKFEECRLRERDPHGTRKFGRYSSHNKEISLYYDIAHILLGDDWLNAPLVQVTQSVSTRQSLTGYLSEIVSDSSVHPIKSFGPEFSSDNAGDGPSTGCDRGEFADLPVFSSSNYLSWSTDFKAMLKMPQAYYLDLREEYKNDDKIGAEENLKKKKEFDFELKKLNFNLFRSIYAVVLRSGDENAKSLVIAHQGDDRSALKAWDALSDFHSVTSSQSKLTIVSELFNMKQREDESELEFKTRVQKCHAKLENAKIEFKDIIAAKYLVGLSDQYSDFKSAMLVRVGGDLTVAEIYKQLKNWLASRDFQNETAVANKVSVKSDYVTKSDLKSFLSDYRRGSNDHSSKRQKSDEDNSSPRMSPEEIQEKYPNSPTPFEMKWTCRRCEKPGHAVRTCKMPKNYRAQSKNRQRKNKKKEKAALAFIHPQEISPPASTDLSPPLTDTSDLISFSAEANFVSDQETESAFLSSSSTDVPFIMDSGCTRHMVGNLIDRFRLTNYKPSESSIHTYSGALKALGSAAFGFLRNMLHVPAKENLLSVSQLCDDHDLVVLFDKHQATVVRKAQISIAGQPNFVGKRQNGLYVANINEQSTPFSPSSNESTTPTHDLEPNPTSNTFLSSVAPSNSFTKWHNRLGHFGIGIMDKLKHNSLYSNFSFSFTKKEKKNHCANICEGCAFGKMHNCGVRRKPYPTPSVRSRIDSLPTAISFSDLKSYKPGDLVVADIMHSPTSAILSGSQFALVLMDVASRYTWVYTMKSKDDTISKFKDWLKWMEAHGKPVKGFTTLRTDNGGEFSSADFKDFLKDQAIKRETCPPYAHVYVVERVILTLREMTRAYLWAANVPLNFWAEALAYSVYVLNRLVCKSDYTKTRFERFFGTKPSISNLKTFGCTAYARAYDEVTKKWDPRAWKGRFVGLLEESPKTWKIYNPKTKKYIHTSSVIFDENLVSSKEGIGEDAAVKLTQEALDQLFIDSVPIAPPLDNSESPLTSKKRTEPTTSSSPSSRRSKRIRNNSEKSFLLHASTDQMLEERALSAREKSLPTSLKQALESDEGLEWEKSVKVEVDSLVKNDTVHIVEAPFSAKVLPFKWVFKVKETPSGEIERYKSRLTVGGHRQQYGIDYDETFAPVARYTTIRTLLAVSAQKGLILEQMDVDTAFLYAKLPVEDPYIYMKVPDYYPIPEHLKGKTNLVARLNKSLYGLKQAPRLCGMRPLIKRCSASVL